MSAHVGDYTQDVLSINATSSTDAAAHTVAESHDDGTHALYTRAIFMLILIVITINLHGVAHKMKFQFLGESALTIILGLIVATLFTFFSYTDENTTIQLSSKFFYMVLLPPIIFEGGFNLRRVSFFKNFLTIITLAFVGALYSTFVTSVLMYYFSKLVFPLSFIESLVFGCLISSTDPVTVLSLLPSNVDRRLYMLIFGESALNDAVSIILFRFFTSIADPKMRLGVGPFFMSVLASSGVFLGSFMCGTLIALIYAKITKEVKMPDRSMYELTMLLIFAYLSYLIADVIELAGIISIFFCGIGMAHYAYPNLSEETKTSLKISILISRTHVFLIIGIRNAFGKSQADKIPFNHQVLLWFSGLRGAVAFALGVSFLEHPVFDGDVKGMIFGTTVMVVVLTVIILGGLTPHMLKWLGIVKSGNGGAHAETLADGQHHDQQSEYAEIVEEVVGDEEEGVRTESDKESFFVWLYNLDIKYIRPYFSTLPPPEPRSPSKQNSMRIDAGAPDKGVDQEMTMKVNKTADLIKPDDTLLTQVEL